MQANTTRRGARLQPSLRLGNVPGERLLPGLAALLLRSRIRQLRLLGGNLSAQRLRLCRATRLQGIAQCFQLMHTPSPVQDMARLGKGP